jgi:hypothetical protein
MDSSQRTERQDHIVSGWIAPEGIKKGANKTASVFERDGLSTPLFEGKSICGLQAAHLIAWLYHAGEEGASCPDVVNGRSRHPSL